MEINVRKSFQSDSCAAIKRRKINKITNNFPLRLSKAAKKGKKLEI